MHKKFRKNKVYIIGIISMIFLLGMVMLISISVQANIFNDIQNNVNNALFDGLNLYGAGLLLSIGILASLSFSLAIAKFEPLGIAITVILMVGFLVAIEWLESWVLLLSLVVIGAFLSKRLSDTLSGMKGN